VAVPEQMVPPVVPALVLEVQLVLPELQTRQEAMELSGRATKAATFPRRRAVQAVVALAPPAQTVVEPALAPQQAVMVATG
jgi:hypothetical protein